MLDRSKCKRMLVWDGKRPKEPKERIVIEVLADGSCYTVAAEYEKEFNAGDWFEVDCFGYCEEIPEKKLRHATREEWVYWASSADALGWVVRYGGCMSYAPQCPKYKPSDIHLYERAKIPAKGEELQWESFLVEG